MRLIFLFVAIALAAGAFAVTMHFTKEEKKPETEQQQASANNTPAAPAASVPVVVKPQVIVQKVPTRDIYTAKTDIPVGTIIRQDMLDIQPWPEHLILPDMVEADQDKNNNLVKMIARTGFVKGEPIIRTKLANDKDPSFIAGSLPKGMRLVTIATDVINGAGGFVFPGDHVDILITHSLPLDKPSDAQNGGNGGANGNGYPNNAPNNPGAPGAFGNANTPKPPVQVTEVFMSNVRVIAVGVQTATHSGDKTTTPSNVSLEVTPTDAQRIQLAEAGNGHLSLVLRSIKDADDVQLARPTGVGDLSRLTPPSYFSVLYDGSATPTAPTSLPEHSEAAPEKPVVSSVNFPVIIVRGVHEEQVEVMRP